MYKAREILRNSLNGSIQKERDFSILIKKFFTDTNGTVVDKSSVPSVLQTRYPFHIFGDFDKPSGYAVGNKVLPPINGTYFVGISIIGLGGPSFLQFQGAPNPIRDQFNLGDLVFLYADSPTAPNFFVWIVINNLFDSGYASIVANTEGKELPGYTSMKVDKFLYINSVDAQFNQSLFVINYNQIGVFEANQYEPLSFKFTDTKQDNFISIPLKFVLSQYIALSSYILHDTDQLQFVFTVRF